MIRYDMIGYLYYVQSSPPGRYWGVAQELTYKICAQPLTEEANNFQAYKQGISREINKSWRPHTCSRLCAFEKQKQKNP